MDTAAAATIARSLMDQHGLTGWSLVFDRARTRAGVCRWGKKEIGLSAPYVRLNDETEVRDAILHEIAHALVGPKKNPRTGKNDSHGPAWKVMARKIGADPERLRDAQITEQRGRYQAQCPGHEEPHVVAHYFRRPGRRMLMGGFCKTHKKPVNWIDSVSGTPLVAPLHQDVTVFDLSILLSSAAPTRQRTPAKKPPVRKPEPAWVSGSSDWDKMFGDA